VVTFVCNYYSTAEGKKDEDYIKIFRGFSIDFKKFRISLYEKYSVKRAYVFLGYIEDNESFYDALFDYGYECVFKKATKLPDGKIKANCDADLVLHAVRTIDMYEQALLISGDGDFLCLVEHLIFHKKLRKILVSNKKRYSYLFRGFHSYVSDTKDMEYLLHI
jgi:uncharacterized LabA/DUF88 family protein